MADKNENTVELDLVTKKFISGVEAKTDNLNELGLDKYSLGPWSISKLKMLEKCPFQFYLKYVLKIKVPKEIAIVQDSLSTDVGSAAHRILEFIVLGKSIQEAFKATKTEFSSKITDEQWNDNVLTLEYNIIRFKERLDAFEQNNKIKRVLTELRLGVTRDWKPTGFFSEDVYFRGIIDLIIQLENGDILIIDHKTGAASIGGIRHFESQLNSYKPLFHFGSIKVRGAQAGIHFIREGELTFGEFHTTEEIEKKLVDRLEWLLEGAIESVKSLGYFKHIRGNQCKWCEFNDQCKPGLLKPIELKTKKYFNIKEIK